MQPGRTSETVTSLLEGMANQGYKGSEAGTAMAAIMRDITNGMKDGAIKIGETSVAVMDAQGNFRDLTDILTEVEAATNGMGDAERAVALSSTFTADSTKGLNLILNEGMDNIAGYEEELRGASGSAEEMANIMNDNLSGDVAAMNSAFEELGLKIYDALESKLRAGVQFITNGVIPAIEWLGGHIPEVTIAVSGLGAVIAAMNWGTISSKIAMVKGALVKLAAALGGVSLPAIAIIAVITAVALAFTNLWKNNEEFMEQDHSDLGRNQGQVRRVRARNCGQAQRAGVRVRGHNRSNEGSLGRLLRGARSDFRGRIPADQQYSERGPRHSDRPV